MNAFQQFSTAVHKRYNELSMGELFRTDVEADDLWQVYLSAFPEGTNPIFRERTEHDCSCCRNFIKNLGRVVGLKDGLIQTVWEELGDMPAPYGAVAQVMAIYMAKATITGVYRTKEVSYGAQFNHERTESGQVLTWHHFHGTVYPQHRNNDPASVAGELNSTAGVFKRGLDEISVVAVQEVLDLIAQNALYRGAEFQGPVAAFQALQNDYLEGGRNAHYHWANFQKPGARIRNTAIGTLLQNLSEGMALEAAVAAFERTVAPENYKRTSALITPKMIEAGLATLRELGLESAVNRRHATLADVSINNVIWADGSVQPLMRDTLADALLSSSQVKKTSASKLGLDITIDQFMAEVVPQATGLEVLVANSFGNNFVSLTAPVDAEVGQLFKWPNNFGWSYNGNVTDSIKEKVKAAGGNVTNAKLRVSLAWFNGDDLDIHAHCPDGHIYFGNKARILDVDMNAGGARNSTDPVENLSWVNPRDGVYTILVNQYNARSRDNVGFMLEVENEGKLTQYSYSKAQRSSESVTALVLTVANGVITDIKPGAGVVGQGISREVWGIPTEQYVKVQTLMFSPNHWDGNKVGNKHWFFLLEGCKNPEPCRGIYNEYLIPELDQHRKVFEVLGAKTMCPVTDDQLSGLGFSSTRKDTLTVRATGSKGSEVFNVQF